MSATIVPYGPVQAAELANDAEVKAWANVRAHAALCGLAARRFTTDSGATAIVIGSRTFSTLTEAEDWLGIDG